MSGTVVYGDYAVGYTNPLTVVNFIEYMKTDLDNIESSEFVESVLDASRVAIQKALETPLGLRQVIYFYNAPQLRQENGVAAIPEDVVSLDGYDVNEDGGYSAAAYKVSGPKNNQYQLINTDGTLAYDDETSISAVLKVTTTQGIDLTKDEHATLLNAVYSYGAYLYHNRGDRDATNTVQSMTFLGMPSTVRSVVQMYRGVVCG